MGREKTEESETQTSLPPVPIDKPEIRDDEVLECITSPSEVAETNFELISDDEVDEATKQASSVVFTELKSVLHLEVIFLVTCLFSRVITTPVDSFELFSAMARGNFWLSFFLEIGGSLWFMYRAWYQMTF